MTVRKGLVLLVTAAVFVAGCLQFTDEPGGSESTSGTIPPALEDTGPDPAEVDPTPPPAPDPISGVPDFGQPAPVRVIATQGPIAEGSSYVLVTWDHAVRGATSYNVERDGQSVGSIPVDGESWNDASLRDNRVPVGTHRYRVRAVTADGPGPWSTPVEIEVRASSDFGPVFEVDSFGGSDLSRAQQATDAAARAGGGIVLFGPRTYVFDDPLLVYGDNILLRGAGQNETFVKPGFPGGEESCGRVTPLLLFQSGLEPVGSATVAERARASDTKLVFDRAPSVQAGDIISVDGVIGQLPTHGYIDEGIAQDPTIPNDERYPYENATVVSVQDRVVEIDHPLSQDITPGAELWRYEAGRGNGVELLTVEGTSAEDRSYHRLIDVRDQVDFRVADVTARWANRNFMDVSGHRITVIGFTGVEGGAGGYELEACKYKLGFGPATDVMILGGTFGSTEHDRNMSLVTVQFVYRVVVRASSFGGSRTYGFNEHGGGSRDLVFENNYVSAGPGGWAGILLGNDTWGFGGETAIRNNRFVNNVNDVLAVEHPYGLSFVNNHSTGCTEACLLWAGWGGEHSGYAPIPDPDSWGSAKIVIADNLVDGAAEGFRLGVDSSAGFPYEGVRDAVIVNNTVQASGPALALAGMPDQTGRLWIAGNSFSGGIEANLPGDDWWFWANEGGLPGDEPVDLPSWADPYQDWER